MNVSATRALRLVLAAGAAGVSVGLLTGCESDSFFDPSVVGRWEHTPTKVPILERIASIEEAKGDLVEISSPTTEDLYSDPRDYRVGPGDVLQIEIYDFTTTGQPEQFERAVDPTGTIDLPQLGRLFVSGQSIEGVRETISDAMKKFVAEPLVGVVIRELRQQTFTMVGAVERPGPYFIPSIDYKLVEASTSGGRIDESTKELLVIRSVPLDERAMSPRDTRRSPLPSSGPVRSTLPNPSVPNEPPKSGESLIDLIDQLSKPEGAPATPSEKPLEAPKPQGEPPVQLPDTPGAAPVQPVPAEPAPKPAEPKSEPKPEPKPEPKKEEPKPATPPVDLPSPGMVSGFEPSRPGRTLARLDDPRGGSPVIDLPDGARAAPAANKADEPATSWVFLDGKWVQLAGPAPQAGASGTKPEDNRPRVVAQRVIRIPYKQLLDGDASVNIVVRPGDVVRVPSPPVGEIYVDGQVNRPGVYNIPQVGRLTLTRVITAAGGLSNLAIPERVDLTRVVGEGQQAIVRLDLRAITEGTQPDVYLKPDDRINVGTNFWALPLAVIRSGFRANYGFGLVVDRNFGSDIFGVPPEAQSRNSGFF
jgi:protein involved in polysaccharide export with SLBB domain